MDTPYSDIYAASFVAANSDATLKTLTVDNNTTLNSLTVAENTNSSATFGRAVVGSIANNADTWARLSHSNQAGTATSYACAQNQDGDVLINCPGPPANRSIRLGTNSTDIRIDTNVSVLKPLKLHENHCSMTREFDLDALDQDWHDIFTVTLTDQTSTHLPVSFKLWYVQSANTLDGRCSGGEAYHFAHPAEDPITTAAFTKYHERGGNLDKTQFQLIRDSDTNAGATYTVQYRFNHSSHTGVTLLVNLCVLGNDAAAFIAN